MKSVEELLEAADAIHDLPPDERDSEGRAAVVAELHAPNFGKVVPTSFRLEALARLLSEGVPEEWTLPTEEDGNTPTHRAVFEAAASAPLISRHGQPSFDRNRFLPHAL